MDPGAREPLRASPAASRTESQDLHLLLPCLSWQPPTNRSGGYSRFSRPGLADVQPSTDRADRRNAIRCQLTGEYLGRLLLKRVRTARATGRALRCRLTTADDIMSSS